MIYLIRHADAVPAEQDHLRTLSEKGRGQVARVCEALSKAGGFAPAELWHSPLCRARETAELLAQGLGLDARVVLKEGLEPDDDPLKIARLLDEEKASVAVVGHEPHLGALATLMARGPLHANPLYHFSKASVLVLSRRDGRWRSQWFVRTP